MSVLAECLSVVVRNTTLEAKYPGGSAAYQRDCPNGTICSDGKLTRVGFMTPDDVKAFVETIRAKGLVWLVDGEAEDLVVVDQHTGWTSFCRWLEGGRHRDGYSAVWLAGTVPGRMATPPDWTPDQSRGMKFVASNQLKEKVMKLAEDDGLEVWLDFESGAERFMGRTTAGRKLDQSDTA
jgi:hypothetical protein